MDLTSDAIAFFNARVSPGAATDCWNWTGGIQKLGYGLVCYRVGSKRRTQYAHRAAYFLANGEFDLSMNVMHSCDNRKCCNPAHLSLGTHLDNMRDKTKKGRHVSMPGSSHPMSKLTDEEVILIYKQKYKCVSQKLADLYKVDASMIRFIWQGKSWGHLTKNIAEEEVIPVKLNDSQVNLVQQLKLKLFNGRK